MTTNRLKRSFSYYRIPTAAQIPRELDKKLLFNKFVRSFLLRHWLAKYRRHRVFHIERHQDLVQYRVDRKLIGTQLRS